MASMATRWCMLAGAALALGLTACSPPPPPPLAAGQTWMIHSHRGDGATSTTVLAIAPSTPLGPVAFVTVNNMILKMPDGTRRNKLGPTAFTLAALQASLKDYQFRQGADVRYEGYVERWRAHAAQGRAAEYTYDVPVAQALDAFERGQRLPTTLATLR